MKTIVPAQFDLLRERARRAIAPIKPIDSGTQAKHDFLFSGKRAVGADALPHPCLIYFLFIDLLGFKDLGRFEKLAWSIPIDLEGKAFLLEHRKFGVGVFVQDDGDTDAAKRVAGLIGTGVSVARPYFRWKADQAVAASQFNVVNNGIVLFRRFEYSKNLYVQAHGEAERRKNEVIRKKFKNGETITRPYYRLLQEARWLAMAAIEAFFSWTEHIFVHIAILNGSIASGAEFAVLSGAEWNAKFKRALDISDSTTKAHYDALIEIRRQLRNFIAHGAFGKEGETLRFHSNAGAVPVLLDVTARRGKFMLGEELQFDCKHAFDAIEFSQLFVGRF